MKKQIIVPALLLMFGCNDQNTVTERLDEAESPSPYLYVWARDMDLGDDDTDFLATINADPASSEYGRVISTAPVGSTGTGAHHAEPVAPTSGFLFANGFDSNRTFLFDISNREAPTMVGELDALPSLSYPHDFRRLPNGNVLVSMQHGDGSIDGDPGGLALFTSTGKLISEHSAADSAFPGAKIRPYSIEVMQDRDRVLSTGRSMNSSSEAAADVVQIWRLSDLTLLKTLAVPRLPPTALPECTIIGDFCEPEQYAGELQPFEIRALDDGSALLSTFSCGFYRIADLESDAPSIEVVLNMPKVFGCSVPARIDRFEIMPILFAKFIATLDVSEPHAPREVARFIPPDGFTPHWVALDPRSNRIVVTANGPDAKPTILILNIDLATGELSLDEQFGAFEDAIPGISFDRPHWQHGLTGTAMPHAALFGY